jgi:hypothetical protein
MRDMKSKVSLLVGNFPRRTLVCILHVVFKIPYTSYFITKYELSKHTNHAKITMEIFARQHKADLKTGTQSGGGHIQQHSSN